ncbi:MULTISPECIES: hypothetical protein [unclassified Luteococcus]|uniref:hypothetical protein n=1 Tax=unclassified Luteococcus TaxID=2639923 RepID=UPI00313DFE65
MSQKFVQRAPAGFYHEPVKFLTEALGALREVIVDGLQLLARHWPALLGWFLLGAAGRRGFMWLAVATADVNRTLGALILPLAPISTLLSLVMMLRSTAASLPAFAGFTQAHQGRNERLRGHLVVATEVLIPFLAVYSAQGLLRTDVTTYIHSNTADEWLNEGLAADFARSTVAPEWLLLTLVVVALVLRKTIVGFELPRRHLGWAALNGYLEALWMVTLGAVLTHRLGAIQEWVTTRAVIVGIIEQYQRFVAWAGAIGTAFQSLVDAISTLLGNLSAIVVLPVAWLAIGAAVYGAQLREGTLSAPEIRTQQLRRIPSPVRRVVAQSVEPVTTPVKETAAAIGRVAAAGIIPMVLFCLVFVAAGELQVGVAWLQRWLVGPQEGLARVATEPFLQLGQQAVYFVVAMALLAAAVNRVVGAQTTLTSPEGSTDAGTPTPQHAGA